MPPAKKRSEAHKAAMAAGREESAIVKQYLDALEAHQPRRGRKRTRAAAEQQLTKARAEYETASSLRALTLAQTIIDLERELSTVEAADELPKLEAEFVKVAKRFSERRGITYTAWRQIGVSADTLRKAGIPRTRRDT